MAVRMRTFEYRLVFPTFDAVKPSDHSSLIPGPIDGQNHCGISDHFSRSLTEPMQVHPAPPRAPTLLGWQTPSHPELLWPSRVFGTNWGGMRSVVGMQIHP